MVREFSAFVRVLRCGLAIWTISIGPEARSIPAWGNAPGQGPNAEGKRAEGPIHISPGQRPGNKPPTRPATVLNV
jgi:hypothetical protein